MRKVILTLLFISLFINLSLAQDPGDISTDRPDQTEAPDVLQPGYVQIETGGSFERYTFDFENAAKFTLSTTSVSTLIRIGVFPSLEFRIAPEYQSIEDKIEIFNPNLSHTNKVNGFVPLVLGAKIKIVDESKDIPAMSFLFHVDIPKFASEEFKSANPTPEVRLAASKSLTDRFSLGINLGAEFSIDNRQTVGIYTVSLAADIINKLGGFIEVYGYVAERTSSLIDGGLTYLIMKNLQVDVFAGTGLTENTPDFSLGAGLSVRLPR